MRSPDNRISIFIEFLFRIIDDHLIVDQTDEPLVLEITPALGGVALSDIKPVVVEDELVFQVVEEFGMGPCDAALPRYHDHLEFIGCGHRIACIVEPDGLLIISHC